MSREEDIFHADVQRTFATDYGQRVINNLVETYCRGTFAENPFKMAHKVGQSDLVMHLVSLIEQELPKDA